MTVRFPDKYLLIREVDGLSDPAFRLCVASFFWSANNHTDGVIPPDDLRLVRPGLRDPSRLVAECVRRGAWHEARHECESEKCPAPVEREGWVIHNFFAEMPRQAAVEACEAGKSKGGVDGNHRRWHLARGVRKQGCEFCYPLIGSVTDRISDRSTDSDTDSRASDFDFDSRSSPSQSVKIKDLSDTDRISDDPSVIASHIRSADPAAIACQLSAIASELTIKARGPVSDYDTQHVTALYLDRAAKAGNPVDDFIAYVIASVRREPNIGQVLASVIPSLNEIRKMPVKPVTGIHPYEHNRLTGVCAREECQMPQFHARHQAVKSA